MVLREPMGSSVRNARRTCSKTYPDRADRLYLTLMGMDDEIEDALGSPFGWDGDDIRVLFCDGAGVELVRAVCDQCGNREIAAVRRIRVGDEDLLVAGRLEDVAIPGTRLRRIVDGEPPRRKAPRVMIIDHVGAGDLMCWCRKHKRLVVPYDEVARAIERFDRVSTATPLAKAQTIRVKTKPRIRTR